MKRLRALLCLLTFRHKWHGRDLIWLRERGHATFCVRCGALSPFVDMEDQEEFDAMYEESK